MRDLGENPESLSGSLLVSHPKLLSPSFKQTVILISVHSDDEGAFGVIINRPLGKCLGDIQDEFDSSPLAAVPLYSGGPVMGDQLILSAWRWLPESGTFKLYFGISPDKAEAMLEEAEPGLEVRGFLGYAGWGKGQIENELKQDSWVVSAIDGGAIETFEEVELWRRILGQNHPELRWLADAPDNPSRN
jgi:putative transcriptional regulator